MQPGCNHDYQFTQWATWLGGRQRVRHVCVTGVHRSCLINGTVAEQTEHKLCDATFQLIER